MRDRQVVELAAAEKSISADICYTVSELHALQPFAEMKSIIADFRYATENYNFFQIGTHGKRTFTNELHTFGNRNTDQMFAVKEGTAADFPHPAGDSIKVREELDRKADQPAVRLAEENAFLHGQRGMGGRDKDFFQPAAGRKRIDAELNNAVRDGDALDAAGVFKRAVPDSGNRIAIQNIRDDKLFFSAAVPNDFRCAVIQKDIVVSAA